MAVAKIRGTVMGGHHNLDHKSLGSILGFPISEHILYMDIFGAHRLRE